MKKAALVLLVFLGLLMLAGCSRYIGTARFVKGTAVISELSVGNHTNYNSTAKSSTSKSVTSSKSSASKSSASSKSSTSKSGASSSSSSQVYAAGFDNSSSSSGGSSSQANAAGLSSSASSGGGGGFTVGTVLIVAVVVVILVVLAGRRKKKAPANPVNAQPQYNRPTQDQIIGLIRQHDPSFSSENFLSWSKQVFVQLQEAWEERNWKKVRPFESEELFNLHKTQLDEYIKNGTINVMDNVCVNEAYLFDYKAEGTFEYLSVFMQTSYNDYIIREDTKQVVKGDPQTRYDVSYIARFKRTLGVTTGAHSNASTTRCPNCGAPVDVNAAGQCSYCDTVITNGEHDWVMCNLDDVR